jgi:hypothetical protein
MKRHTYPLGARIRYAGPVECEIDAEWGGGTTSDLHLPNVRFWPLADCQLVVFLVDLRSTLHTKADIELESGKQIPFSSLARQRWPITTKGSP